MQTEKLPHHALHPVSLNSYAYFLAYGKTESPRRTIFSFKYENNQVLGKMTTAPSIAVQKLGPSDQMILFGKS